MNRVMFLLAVSVMIGLGWFYMQEMGEVQAARAAVTAAAETTATKLSQSADPQKNTDADAEGIFKQTIAPSAEIDELAVQQKIEALAPGRFRQLVIVKGRARTTLSKNFNMEGAELNIVATRDFERSQ